MLRHAVRRTMHGRTHRSALLAIGLLTAAPSATPALRIHVFAATSRFVLTELRSVSLPASTKLGGATLAADGRIAYWSTDDDGIRITDGTQQRSACRALRARPIAAAFSRNSTDLELLDARSRSILRVGADGRCIQVLKIPAVSELLGGAQAGRTWVIGATDERGRSVVVRVEPEGHPTELLLHVATGGVDDPMRVRYAHMRSSEGTVLLSAIHWPFAWVEMTAEGRIARRTSLESTTSAGLRDSLAGWIGLGVVPLDTGYVLTVADPRSDERRIVLFDLEGRPMRSSSVRASWGALAAMPKERQLLAVRRTNVLGLVVYKWRWRHDP